MRGVRNGTQAVSREGTGDLLERWIGIIAVPIAFYSGGGLPHPTDLKKGKPVY